MLVALWCQAQSEFVSTGSIPAWVERIESPTTYSDSANPNSTSFYYLLVDRQKNLEAKDWYGHYIIKMLNNEGLQEKSDITINLDPAYETLKFHQINIIREGKLINKLVKADIKVVQRETAMERHLYDGSLTAIINVTDMRIGDILEYSYTITGGNPILEDTYSTTMYLQFSLPIDRLYTRIVAPKDSRIKLKLFKGGEAPQIIKKGRTKEYIWDLSKIPPLYTDINSPSWYDAFPSTSVSEYQSWSQVINQFSKLYVLSESERSQLKEQFDKTIVASDTESFIMESIRFIEDEIRYLGFEGGLNGYKPQAPDDVLDQRYGDCKAKSLLLCEVLRSNGVDAWPVLVHSYDGRSMEDYLPSPSVFNHCVVQIKRGYSYYYVDPTIANQGGDMEQLYFPNYYFGLVLNPEGNGLTALPTTDDSYTRTTETFTLDPVGGGASLYVRTVYSGGAADNQRAWYAESSLSTIQRDFVNFYSSLYPSIQAEGTIEVIDERENDNEFIVVESYRIDSLWEQAPEDSQMIYVEFFPLSIKNTVIVKQSPRRTMPYYVNYPIDVSHTTIVHLPETWGVTQENSSIKGDGFVYNYSVNYNDQTINILHNYKTYKSYISAEAVEEFIAKHDDIFDNLSYYITYTKGIGGEESVDEFKLSWTALFIALACLSLGSYLAVIIYRNYDVPVENSMASAPSIGGWLILVAIGLTLSPFKLAYEIIFIPEFFNSNVWGPLLALDGSGSAVFLLTALLMFVELIYNMFLLPFVFMILFLFYNRRTSLPRMVIILYASTFIFVTLDTIAALNLNYDAYTSLERQQSYRDITQSLVVAAIWIPYFIYSSRVKKTFVFTSKRNTIEEKPEDESDDSAPPAINLEGPIK